ncbi:MAG: PIN domain-containing protein [Isosphaeraceae bacterium]
MQVLIDTGILLRLLDRSDPSHAAIRQSLVKLRIRGDEPVTSTQNIAEFWNVCTRPVSARGGYGLSVGETDRRVRMIERLFPVMAEAPGAYVVWRQLVVAFAVHGVQVHDVRLVALMAARGITHLLTLNGGDFARFSGLVTPLDPAKMP